MTGVDQTALYDSITKESFVLTNARDIPFMLRRAFRVATSGRPAPVHIRVPINVFHEEAEVDDLHAESEYSLYPAHRPVADHGRIRAAIDVLLSARMPVIVCGQGALISRATEAVLELAEMLQIPVATTTLGKGTIPENHPLVLRVIGGRGGMEYSNQYVFDADTIFFVGSNTDSAATEHWKLYGDPKTKTFMHLDIAEAHVGNNFPLKVGMIGDARASLEYMVELIKSDYSVTDREPLDLNAVKKAALDKVFFSNISMPDGAISPVKLCQALYRILPSNAIVTSEPSVSAIYPSALLTIKEAGRRYITN